MSDTTLNWVARREPPVPPALASHLAAALGVLPPHDASSSEHDPRRATAQVIDDCLDAAEAMLARVLADGATGRATALDLLTADALVTYAFEAASEHPDTLPVAARNAMARLSRTAAAVGAAVS